MEGLCRLLRGRYTLEEMMIMKNIYIKMIAVFILISLFILPGSAQTNDACYGSGCHSDKGSSYYINNTRYNANSHGLLECIDCHNSSQNPLDPEHGKFLRTLNGTNLTPPLYFTQYNRSSFLLCYYCHNETQITGLPAGYSNNLWTHRPSAGYPLSIGEPGTNFINERIEGHNFGNYPANIHWDHLDMHGINDDRMWDSNRDGILDSMTGCTACHDPHGNVSGPALTRKDLGIEYGTDATGEYGIINSLEYLYTGGDVYCYGCHGYDSSFKYYRTSRDLMKDCTACHVPYDVNISKFVRHANINTSDGTGNVTNNDCWTCHYLKDMNRSHVYMCESCHKNSSGIVTVSDQALLVGSLQHGSNNCKSCHAPDMYHSEGKAGPKGRVENPGWQLISPIDNTGCHDCHRTHNGLDEPFHAPGIDPNTTFGSPGDHSNTNSRIYLDNYSDCYSSCHVNASDPHNIFYSTNSQTPTVSNPVLSSSLITINTPVDISALGSAQDRSVSLQIEAARYRIRNSTGQVVLNWIGMNPRDGKFNSSLETVNATINTAGLPEGNYYIIVGIMASGPRSDWSKRAYPLNGDWGYSPDTLLVIEQPRGFINGTVRNGSISGTEIQGVTVRTNTDVSTVTNSTGFYSLRLANGTYALTATKDPEYYLNITIPSVTVTAPATLIQNIIMTKKPTGRISGIVTNISSG